MTSQIVGNGVSLQLTATVMATTSLIDSVSHHFENGTNNPVLR